MSRELGDPLVVEIRGCPRTSDGSTREVTSCMNASEEEGN